MALNTTHSEAFEADHAEDRRQRKAPTPAKIAREDLLAATSGDVLGAAVVHDSTRPAKPGTLVLPLERKPQP